MIFPLNSLHGLAHGVIQGNYLVIDGHFWLDGVLTILLGMYLCAETLAKEKVGNHLH